MHTTTSLRLGRRLYHLDAGLIMGVINITPDSFFKDSRHNDDHGLLEKVDSMLEQGMDILDVGAFSSRPGAIMISEKEEWERLEPILSILSKKFTDLPVSLDTFRSKIARRAVQNFGVSLINDISAGRFDAQMPQVIAELKVPIVLMHMLGDPGTMQENPVYKNVVNEVFQFLGERAQLFMDAGAEDIILDPGFGFGKTAAHNFTILGNLDQLQRLGYPILVGLSRKSMVYKSLDIDPDHALNGTSVLNTIARKHGADILRVHDILEAKQCLILSNLLASTDTLTFRN